jgi:hypothetical protein
MNSQQINFGRIFAFALAFFACSLNVFSNDSHTHESTSKSQEFFNTVNITQIQAISCTGDETAQIAAEASGGTPPYTYLWDNGSTDPILSGIGAGTYSVTVTDADGIESQSSFEVTEPNAIQIVFNTTPTSNCGLPGTGSIAATVSGGTGQKDIVWNNGAVDATISNLLPGTYTLLATDENNCQAQLTTVVFVMDNVVPEVLVKELTLTLDENGSAIINANDVDNGSSDNCGIVNSSLTKTHFDCDDLGENALTYTVYDAAGNSAAEEAIVHVFDETPPTAQVDNMVLSLDEYGFAVLDPEMVAAASFDNCGIVSKELSKTNFSCIDIGDEQVTLTLIDGSGLITDATFTVTVVDDLAPTVTFIPNAVLYLNDNGLAFATYETLISDVHDNCGIDLGAFEETTFSCTQVGPNTVTYNQIDFYGNIASTDGSVLILDTIRPKFTIQNIDIELDMDGMAYLSEEMLLPFAEDNCGIAEVAIQYETFDCNEIGTAQTEIIVFDLHGNATQQTLYINLIDPFFPQATAADITLELNENGEVLLDIEMLTHSFTDNCAITDVSLSQTLFTCADGASTTAMLLVTDAAGNTTESEFTVTILDKIDPTIVCSGPVYRCEGPFQAGNLVMADDNCGYMLGQIGGPVNGTNLSPGEYELTYIATDAAGNSATCDVPIIVAPQPVVDLGADLEVPVGEVVILTAGSDPNQTYLWSTGETTSTIEHEVLDDITISVVVSSSIGCEANDEVFISAEIISGIQSVAASNGLSIYPNPTKGIVNVAIESKAIHNNASVLISDLNGRIVHREYISQIGNGLVISVDLTALSKGMYVLAIEADALYSATRIVKD